MYLDVVFGFCVKYFLIFPFNCCVKYFLICCMFHTQGHVMCNFVLFIKFYVGDLLVGNMCVTESQHMHWKICEFHIAIGIAILDMKNALCHIKECH
jgi:hypothetical protein